MPRPIHPVSYQGQCIVLVLAALYEMRRIKTKQETIGYIASHGWFAIQGDDTVPYPSHRRTNNEPRWHTRVAFGRQWAVERDLMTHFEGIDQWEISAKGIERFETVRDKLRSGQYKVRHGYFWSPVFKKWLCPDYEPSDTDTKRPPDIDDEFI
jgi:hypothetical protein